MNVTSVASSKSSPWPYAIAGYFAVAITGIVIFITWAVKQNMDLVRSDYYEQEIFFQKHIDAAARTKALGARAALTFDAKTQVLLVRVPAAHVVPSFKVKLHLYRPSNAKLDRHLELTPGTTGEQLVSTTQFASGLWKARSEWTANSEAYILETTLVME